MDELFLSLNENSDVMSGCTANVVLVSNDKIYCANAGDSRSILSRNG